jgi:hypothetical protein
MIVAIKTMVIVTMTTNAADEHFKASMNEYP